MHKGSITSLVVAALTETGRPMSLSELADAVRTQGYQHSVQPKNPAQLRQSIAALPAKTARIRRVGSGMYDLADRG